MSNKSISNSYEFKQLQNFWAIDDYVADHLTILKERENNRIAIDFSSQQIINRSTLVNFVKEIAIHKHLDQLSIHLAVYIFDVFMDIHDIKIDKLKLVALSALLLATKFEERDCRILKTSEVHMFAKQEYSLSEYNIMEILILKYLNWNMNVPTVVHFVNVYLPFLFSEEEKSNMSADIWYDVRQHIKKCMDLVIDDITLTHEKPSKVAAAIMACIRANLKHTKIYPLRLFEVSNYRLFELKVLIRSIKSGLLNVNNNSL